MLEWSDGPTVRSCGDWDTLSGADGKGMLLRRKWQNKVPPAFHPISHSVAPSQLLFPSVSPSFFLSFSFTFSIELAHTIELGSVSAIEWLELMANYLPL